MKITKSQLKQIIKEELGKVLNELMFPFSPLSIPIGLGLAAIGTQSPSLSRPGSGAITVDTSADPSTGTWIDRPPSDPSPVHAATSLGTIADPKEREFQARLQGFRGPEIQRRQELALALRPDQKTFRQRAAAAEHAKTDQETHPPRPAIVASQRE